LFRHQRNDPALFQKYRTYFPHFVRYFSFILPKFLEKFLSILSIFVRNFLIVIAGIVDIFLKSLLNFPLLFAHLCPRSAYFSVKNETMFRAIPIGSPRIRSVIPGSPSFFPVAWSLAALTKKNFSRSLVTEAMVVTQANTGWLLHKLILVCWQFENARF
jgi:hypothetical protein